MFGLKKLLFGDGSLEHLPTDVKPALEAWRQSPAPALDESHFLTRYVVVDIVSSGLSPETDRLLGIAATSVYRGAIKPDDAFFIDFSEVGDDAAAVDRQLMAFLQFVAKAPMVTYHIPYVGGFLQRAFKERLGVNFQPQWVDLAWLLPAMFEEKSHKVMPLDQWLEAFGFPTGSGRRNPMENTLVLARIFQMLLVRASLKDVDTAGKLVAESRASSFLRRNH